MSNNTGDGRSMMTLRCTKRLLGHFSERPTVVALAAEVEPLLGEWYANLFRYSDTDIALCVNEMTRYAIVIPLEGCESISTLYIRLAQRVFDALHRARIPHPP